MQRSERIKIFVSEIWKWFAVHKRTLPWRDLVIADDTQRAYMIFVSEVMLQQTQVPRVEITFRTFLREFPDLKSLAEASNKEVLLAWRGMGYNSRVLRMRDAARTIIKEFNSVFPQDFESLKSIKGIGDYTAAAIRNFAFNLPTPCLDTNIRRILHRVFIGPENLDGTWEKDDKYLLTIAAEVLETASNSQFSILHSQFRRGAAAWHAALMDFGSLVFTKRNPKWEMCPLELRAISKTTEKNLKFAGSKPSRKEPGRLVGSTFIPNRIFRGKIVEALRDAERGLTFETLGKEVCIDWHKGDHGVWLRGILEALENDQLLVYRKPKYVLAD